MDENLVVDRVCRFLQARGDRILQRLTTQERGVDIVAETQAGQIVYIEAKGGTSSFASSARFGREYTRSQVFDRAAKGVFTCVQLRAVHPEQGKDLVVLAVPDSQTFRHYLQSIEVPLALLGVEVWFVGEERVETLARRLKDTVQP